VTAQDRRTGTDTLNSRTEKGAAKKIDEILHKSKGIALKFCTDQIQQTTNLFPKNHRLRLTQTPENLDHDQERKFSPKNKIGLNLDARVKLIQIT
jgi:hypothetical protein